MKKSLLKEYARLIASSGANIQKGQYVVIRTPISNEDFAAMVANECYKLGAKRVVYQWQSSVLDKLDYRYAKTQVLGELTPMEMGLQEFETNELAVLIWLDADDPDGLAGVDPKKFAAIRERRLTQTRELTEKRENKYQWCIAGCPSDNWAKKVFPGLSKKQAREKLWEAILLTSRALDGNGIANWKLHEATLKEKTDKLNALRLKKLHYSSSNGTDFTVGLNPDVIFLAGGEKTIQGVFFEPNIPSEECFTSPLKGVAEGTLVASKPLVYQGQIIENFSISFHEGKAISVQAEKGQEVLEGILHLDDGSAYLGECALVPFDSPINKTGLLFFNTLYDENACCHLALGRGFTQLYPGFEKMSSDEVYAKGINKSSSHVDFMIGTADLEIVGTKETGEEVVLFRNGTWAI